VENASFVTETKERRSDRDSESGNNDDELARENNVPGRDLIFRINAT